MRFMTLALLLFLAACGGGSGGGADVNPSDGPSPADPHEGPAPETQEKAQIARQTAMLVADAAGLPACDQAQEGALAYVKSEKAFKACAAGAWETVDLRGEKGAAGDAGAPGAKGDKGDKGDPAAVNEWFDSVAKRRWLFGPNAVWSDTCGGADWRMPTAAEADAARLHGLFIAAAAASAPQVLWTGEQTAAGVHKAVRADATGFPGYVHTQLDTEAYGHFCVDNL